MEFILLIALAGVLIALISLLIVIVTPQLIQVSQALFPYLWTDWVCRKNDSYSEENEEKEAASPPLIRSILPGI